MLLLDTLLRRVAPFECLGCESEGSLFCTDCAANAQRVPERCYRCRSLSDNWRTCQSCRSQSSLFAVMPTFVYEGLTKDLLWRLKFHGAQAATEDMARHMAHLLPHDKNVLIVPVPTATTRARRRGYDQAVLLAKQLARQTGRPYFPLLRRMGQAHQVGASRTQRIRQLQEAYRIVNPSILTDAHVVLIDDVLTTGATLETAAKVVKSAGAKRVSSIVFAQA